MRKPQNWKREIWHRDKWLCHYCRCQVQGRDHYRSDAATIDHIVPKSQGGMSIKSNMVTACRACNQGKGEMSLAEWERRGMPRKEYRPKYTIEARQQ